MGALYETTNTGCQIIAESAGRGTKYSVYFPDGSIKNKLTLTKARALCEEYSKKMQPKERIFEGVSVVNYLNVCPNSTAFVISWNKSKKQPVIYIGTQQNVRGNFVYNFFTGNDVLSILVDSLVNLKIYPDEADPNMQKLQERWSVLEPNMSYIFNNSVYTPMVVSFDGVHKQQTIFIGGKNYEGKSVVGFYTQTGIMSIPLLELDKIIIFYNESNPQLIQMLQQKWNTTVAK